jgi:hypothetical protein
LAFSEYVISGANTLAATKTPVSQALIHGYTLVDKKLSNIKVSYVNYFTDGTSVVNLGTNTPTMLRIGGTVTSFEYLTADKIKVFFDVAVDATDFLDDPSVSKSIGCSQAKCLYYK